MRDFISKRAKQLQPSGIRKFFDLASTNPNVISLGVGEPDFITPWVIRDAGINSIKKGRTQYTSNSGLLVLRNKISEYLEKRFNAYFKADDIVITIGASEAIDITLRAIVDDGDEVLIPDPSYVSYKPCVELLGGVAVSVACDEKTGFKLTPENLKKAITKKTKALIFPYPNNPTGAIMEKDDIEKIIPIILENDLFVISDEIYAELTYGTDHVSIASFSALDGRVALISGFSKAFAMTGWRLGYVCAPPEVKRALLKIHQYTAICAPIFSQYAGIEALEGGLSDGFTLVKQMRDEYDARRKFMINSFNELGLTVSEPKGAFYVFPCVKSTGFTGEEFAYKLLEKKGVAVVPGSAFGEFGKYYVRCSYAYSMKSLITAMEKISEFAHELNK